MRDLTRLWKVGGTATVVGNVRYLAINLIKYLQGRSQVASQGFRQRLPQVAKISTLVGSADSILLISSIASIVSGLGLSSATIRLLLRHSP